MVAVCPKLLLDGACADTGCGYRHDVKICRPCGVICYNTQTFQAHTNSERHQRRASGALDAYYCSICHTNVPPGDGWTIHIQGKRHNMLATQQGVDPNVQPEEPNIPPGHVHCQVCRFNVREQQWTVHLSSRTHARKSLVESYQAAFEEAEKNKHGISVSHEDGVDFDIVEVDDATRGVDLFVTIKNTAPVSRVSLVNVKFSAARPSFSVTHNAVATPVVYGRDMSITVTLRQQHRGRYEDRLELILEDTALRQRFIIVRTVKAIVGSKADHEALKPKSPYVPRKRAPRTPEVEVVPGVAPPTTRAVPYVGQLPHAQIPPRISSTLSKGSVSRITSYICTSVLPPQLDSATHGRHFKTLLWVEEHRMENDLQMYDIDETQLSRHNQYYYLPVPGLAEKRPSVLVGDIILVHPHGTEQGKWFEGHVHVVRKEEVGLCFHGSFRQRSPSDLYTIRFKLNRIPLRRQHQALDAAFHPDRLVFPSQEHFRASLRPSTSAVNSYIYNRLIVENEAQLQAVASVASQRPGSPPFVIFGPPGTGKTITMVESIRQVLRLSPRACILVCAPSNSAADLIVSRLSMLGTAQLFRFYAPSRGKDQVPDAILPFTHRTADGHFSVPPVAVLKRYKVIVSTCVSASFAHGIGVPRGHFTHVFVDEAGQATEPEVMIAVRTMADNDTNVVLSGDPKQLGPIIRSAVARDLGLEKSYIERLMARPPYDERAGHGISVVKLVKNFRSHEAILKFPNERFYRSELEPCADRRLIRSYIGCSILAKPDFPILVHAISGKDDREASSPSFFNIDEATQVKAYVQSLRSDNRFRTSEADIGIIAPYHAQCKKIRNTLRGVADEIKIGSVEEFQGQERKVIIISTVRSSREFVEYDLKHTLGFVANPRRFNVAVTRAQALLIVVGDPNVLSLDPLWRSFLNYVHVNGGWRGPPSSWDTRTDVDSQGGYAQSVQGTALPDMNDFVRRMEMLTLNGVTSEDAENSDDIDANVDRPWRDVE